MRLQKHINEGRSKFMYVEDTVELIKEKCKQSLKAASEGSALYRGVQNSAGQATYIDPKKHTRTSRNTQNSYTLVIDGSPKWADYPKRSKSIICSNSFRGAAPYGTLFQVFPVDGSNYGVCPKNDIWGSFFESNIMDLSDFNYAMFEMLPRKILNIPDNTTFNSLFGLKKILKMMDEKLATIDFEGHKYRGQLPWMDKYRGNLWELFNELIDPNKNRFKQTYNPDHLPPSSGVTREIWTDGESYMINEMWVRENRGELYE